MKRSIGKKLILAAGILLGLILGFVLFVCVINISMERAGSRHIYSSLEEVPERRVALILGARVYSNGRLSAMLEDRVVVGVELLKAGKAEKLIMSGDNSETHYDEVTAMKRRAVELGADPDDVVRDFAGFRTLDSVYRAREVWEQNELIIVSQRFHLARAVYIAKHLGIDAVGMVADRRPYLASSLRRSQFREVGAKVAAWMDVNVFHKRPRFLGRKEGLSGLAQDQEQAEKDKP